MSKPEQPQSVRITVRAEGDGPPLPIRLRRFLKSALRAYGLRCTSVAPVEPSAAELKQREAG